MIWMVLILIHGVLCVVTIADLASLWMPARDRAGWFIAVLLLPFVGLAAYVLFGRGRYGAEREWPDVRATDTGGDTKDGFKSGNP